MSMALALARASELNDNSPHDGQKEEHAMAVPLSEAMSKKINIASGEDAFVVDADDAWAWAEYESNLKGSMYGS